MKTAHPTILVVEDKATDQRMIQTAFHNIGVSDPIHYVKSGKEAIAYMMGEGKFASREKYAYPTFVLTDLHMKDGDGLDVLEFLKTNPEWAIIPTIVLSRSADLDDIKQSYLLGASSYHVKPANQDGMTHLLLILHAYWMTCEVPEVDRSGRQLTTDDRGKLGERFNKVKEARAKIHRAAK
ncbi:MAG TPA: response regulator [Verrucomicrobiae bacterium]|nr:response regulator [Verrucomicrobiae bacterium]